MAIDTSIYGLSGRGVKSVADYDREYEQLLGARQNRQLGALQLMLGQQKADEYTRGVERANQLRALSGTWKADTTDEQRVASLRNAGFAAEADSLEKGILERMKTRATVDKDTAEAAAKRQADKIKAYEFHVQRLGQVADPQMAEAWLTEGVRSGVMSMQEAQQGLKLLQANPQMFPEWKARTLQGGMSVVEQMRAQQAAAQQAEVARANAAREAATIRGQDLSAETARRGQDIGAATARRGQDMTDARTRELVSTTRSDAVSRRESEKLEAGVQKYASTLQKEGIPELETAVAAAEGALGRYKKGEVPGVGRLEGAIPSALLSDEGNDVRQAVATVRNIVLNARSGAAVTDQELRRMVEELGTGLGQSEDALRRGLQKVRDRLESIKANAAAGVTDDVKGLYEERGGVRIQRGGAKPAAPKDPAAPYADAEKERRYQEWKRKQGL